VKWVDQGIREAFADQKASEFLDWLERKRQILILSFRMAYDQELILEALWHEEIERGELGTDTLPRLCVVTLVRQRIEHALNLLDFGGDYGKQDFTFLERMIGRWITQCTCKRGSERRWESIS
jgi:hypothetical protein